MKSQKLKRSQVLIFGVSPLKNVTDSIQICKWDTRCWGSRDLKGEIEGNLVGNITTITNFLDATRTQSFGYDDLYRLTSAAGVYGTLDYTYDNVDNRLTRTENGQTDV